MAAASGAADLGGLASGGSFLGFQIPTLPATGLFAVAGLMVYGLTRMGGKKIPAPEVPPQKLSSANEGDPIFRAYGNAARVPAVVLWTSDLLVETVTQRAGKNGEIGTNRIKADLMIGLSKHNTNRFSFIRQLLANGENFLDNRRPITLTDTYEAGIVGGDGGVIFNFFQYCYPAGDRAFQTRYWEVAIQTEPVVGDSITVTSWAWEGQGGAFGGGGSSSASFTLAQGHGVTVGTQRLVRIINTSPESTPPSLNRNASDLVNKIRWWWATAIDANSFEIPLAGNTGNASTQYTLPTGGTVRVATRDGTNNPTDLTVFDPDAESIHVTVGGVDAMTFPPGRVGLVENDRTEVRLRIYNGGNNGPVFPPDPRVLFQLDGSPRRLFLDAAFPTTGQIIEIEQGRRGHDTRVMPDGLASYDFPYSGSGVSLHNQDPSPRLQSWVGDDRAPAYRDMAVVAIEGMQLNNFGNNLPNIEGIVTTNDDTVAEAITQHCVFAGIDSADIDVSGVAGALSHAVVQGVQTPVEFINTLSAAFDLGFQDTGTGFRVIQKEDSEIITIPEEHWVGKVNGEPSLTFQNDQSKGPVRSLTLNFKDSNADQSPATVRRINPTAEAGSEIDVNLDIGFTKAEAAAIAERMLQDAQSARFVAKGKLPHIYDHIQEHDVISTVSNGITYNMRVLLAEYGTDGGINLTMVTERIRATAPVASAAEVVSESASNGIPGVSAGVFNIYVGIKLREQEDPEYGLYVAANSFSQSNPNGATYLYYSNDNGESYKSLGGVVSQAAIGFLMGRSETIAAGTAGTFEPSTTFQVYMSSGRLSSVTEDSARNGRENKILIGNEVVHFQTAVEGAAQDIYTVTGLLRGANGTAASAHRNGEMVVVINDAVSWIPIPDEVRGGLVRVKAVPLGVSIDDVGHQDIFIPAKPDRTLIVEPANVQEISVTDNADGTLLLEWTPMDPAEIDYYEVRRGTIWNGATSVYCGQKPQCVVTPLTGGARNYMVKARYHGGLSSPGVTNSTNVTPTNPDTIAEPTATAGLP